MLMPFLLQLREIWLILCGHTLWFCSLSCLLMTRPLTVIIFALWHVEILLVSFNNLWCFSVKQIFTHNWIQCISSCCIIGTFFHIATRIWITWIVQHSIWAWYLLWMHMTCNIIQTYCCELYFRQKIPCLCQFNLHGLSKWKESSRLYDEPVD